jgi:hypothetical protein
MAFDRTDPADLAAMKSEVETDPIGMGYAAVVDQTNQLLKLLNEVENNVGDGSPGQETQVSRVFDVSALLDALDPTELDDNQTETKAADYVNSLIGAAGGEEGFSIAPYKAKFRSMFGGQSNTVAALDAQVQDISRAEALFGIGTVITRDDWFAARNS